MTSRSHWDRIYSRGRPCDLGWFEPVSSTLDLVLDNVESPSLGVVDIGAGTSGLVAELLGAGFSDLTVLDISAKALQLSRAQLRDAGFTRARETVSWVEADITQWRPSRQWHLWHDRAVFHFITGDDEIARYRQTARAGVAPGGRLVVATFSPAGPASCAGLPVRRYSASELAEAFEPDFSLIETGAISPSKSPEADQRPYLYGLFE